MIYKIRITCLLLPSASLRWMGGSEEIMGTGVLCKQFISPQEIIIIAQKIEISQQWNLSQRDLYPLSGNTNTNHVLHDFPAIEAQIIVTTVQFPFHNAFVTPIGFICPQHSLLVWSVSSHRPWSVFIQNFPEWAALSYVLSLRKAEQLSLAGCLALVLPGTLIPGLGPFPSRF